LKPSEGFPRCCLRV